MLLAEITDAAITGGAAGGPLLLYIILERMGVFKTKANGNPNKSRNTLLEEGKRLGAQDAWQDGVTGALGKQTDLLERIKDEIVRLNANLKRD